ncbi:ribosome-associated protein [Geothermobacter ehrlichii]|uniref:Ribosome-associated protein n=1 Tax=Geothermobacter ehrlichii TaxID=213224 RepID=A0A5D3WNT0_9BACT|nr:ribosome biogenesis factor YjgA [Geothermobacter ehrlichii]TYO99309.1 ribosome-associated protein [Geothermobacter ehrlichii]
MSEEMRQSRSARKRAAKLVEALAARLVEGSERWLAGLDLPADLAEELATARATRGHSSRRREVRRLAALLRREPELVERIERHLAGVDAAHNRDRRRFHQLEAWRDRLCSGQSAAEAMAELRRCCPDLDHGELARLSRSACNGDRAAARSLFRLLRQNQDLLT